MKARVIASFIQQWVEEGETLERATRRAKGLNDDSRACAAFMTRNVSRKYLLSLREELASSRPNEDSTNKPAPHYKRRTKRRSTARGEA